MALHRTTVALAAAATLIVSAGCDNLSYRRLDYDNTEATRITTVRVLPGSGDVVVRAAGAANEVRIKRVVRYQGGEPDARYEIKGAELVLDTECGNRCSVSFEVTAPPGVVVQGETGSGNVDLSRVGAVDLRLGSGDIRVTGATGDVRAETGSGNIEVDDIARPVRLRASSGNVTGRGLGGEVDAQADSGNVTIEMTKPASVRAHASSGDVRLVVPAGPYRVRSSADAGDARVGVTDDPSATLVLDVAADSGDVSVTQR